MKRHWFWLEDQPETVADFKVFIDRSVLVSLVTTPADLIRDLVRKLKAKDAGVGLIVDVMLIHNPLLTCPPEWHGQGSKAAYFKTRMGYDAGLVLYEKFMFKNPDVPVPPLGLPPPVIFLTVVEQDLQDLQPRFSEVQSRWAEAHGVPIKLAKVAWARKWDASGQGLLKILRTWEEGVQ